MPRRSILHLSPPLLAKELDLARFHQRAFFLPVAVDGPLTALGGLRFANPPYVVQMGAGFTGLLVSVSEGHRRQLPRGVT
jgi:hypothetical protein